MRSIHDNPKATAIIFLNIPFFSLSDNSDHPIFCHLITPLPALCFSISSSSNTPLSVALQAVDERTLLVMVEQRRSLDALDRPGPFVSVVPDAV